MKFIITLTFLYSSTMFAATDDAIVTHLKKNIPTLIYKIRGHSLDPQKREEAQSVYINTIYFATPLRKNKKSEILSSYQYINKDSFITLKIKDSALFSDKSPITSEDIAVTIKRAILENRKNYRFIVESQKLENISDKIKGIKIINPKTIRIFYNEPIDEHSKWLASWELGIVKASFVNEDGSLKGTPPASGRWKLQHSKSPDIAVLESGEKKISIVHIELKDIPEYLDYIDSNHVIIADTGNLTCSVQKQLEAKLERFDQDNNRIQYLMLDKNQDPFKDKMARQYFASKVREHILSCGGVPQGSIVSDEEKGFLSIKKLNTIVGKFSKKDENLLLPRLAKAPIRMKNVLENCFNIVRGTSKKLSLKFLESDSPNVRCFVSGIPPGEALEALKAFLVPGRIPALQTVVSDAKLQEILGSGLSRVKTINKLNKYLFDESYIAVIKHNGTAHFVSKDSNVNSKAEKIYQMDEYFFND